ncbi:GNAT family N-acetyltransferase [Paenibacillus albiflavus]|uniref:GNAT family N-acetyltransferase n=2 Tax=Paenibacillus albiflavus TaxID=2545760 RepID=A0A4V2WPY7_9BACL|nr:GNAT family N-acetyltransferase [Paenibacillus albiflavus]
MIVYSDDKLQKAKDVAQVFLNSGINRPSEDLPRIQHMIDEADILVTAWDNGIMVGVARAITDYSYCCYLSDLAVDRNYQKQGIGKELVSKVQEMIGEQCMLLLLSAPGAMDYYPRIGFESVDNAFVIRRKR